MTHEPKSDLKIRQRERRGHVKEAGGYTAWTEWQVVKGRKIISRHDTKEQAEAALKESNT